MVMSVVGNTEAFRTEKRFGCGRPAQVLKAGLGGGDEEIGLRCAN